MRRKDREVADLEGQLAILEQCPVCRVAINDPASGVPYLVPLNFESQAPKCKNPPTDRCP